MRKRVLFIAPPYMGLYKDIIEEMEKQNYEVTYIKEVVRPEDPDNIRGYRGFKKFFFVNRKRFSKNNDNYWKNVLNTQATNVYDILFIINGQSISTFVFEELKKRNPHLYSVNFMFDTTKGVYHFEKNFAFFDKIATFDREESAKYNISLLPIYWIPLPTGEIKYKFFGMGAFKKDRYQMFKSIFEFSESRNFNSYIKLYVLKIHFIEIKSFIRKLLRVQQSKVNAEEYNSDISTHTIMPVSEFNKLMSESEIILDTNAPHQDGLTARFMQALGNGKKIVTTNASVVSYNFYSKQQIYLIRDIVNFTKSCDFDSFINSKLDLSHETEKAVLSTRIDNWVKFLLEV